MTTDSSPLFAQSMSIVREAAGSYKHQIARQIEALITSGVLSPQANLPSIRAMTAWLGVSRNTVLGAYDLLEHACLVRRDPGRGFFVAENPPLQVKPARRERSSIQPEHDCLDLPEPVAASGVHVVPPAAPICFDFKVGRPAVYAFPWRRWASWSYQLLRHAGHAMTEYTPAAGLWGLRMQISDYLERSKALRVDPEQIIIVAGIQEGLSLLAAHFLRPGCEVVMEAPGYTGFSNILAAHGAACIALPVDEDGLRTDMLPERSVRMAYVTPSHQYPLGYTMSMARRKSLLAWAARHGALVIEDDYDGDFRYNQSPLLPLMALDDARTVYLGTFSKALGPGVRLGYMVCPRRLADELGSRKALLNNGCPWLDQAVMARLLESGEYARHIYWLRSKYSQQRDAVLAGIASLWGGEGQVSGQDAGMHVACRLPPGAPGAAEVVKRALGVGVRLYTLPDAAGGDEPVQHDRVVLFGYAALDPAQIEAAFGRLLPVLGSH
ncbi:PLP-dependent aminotransferase family protein [Cupriavidus sp. 2KB_3]|uniref:MocR-like pyridoxine biosynthesis transcription factor PdxR n=1 Tax=Cupriavidus TaxID=106589 RepID=UPI0021CCC52E|nr:PLP-dependent aminotransferase family protein [Cupriavidus campinensis]